uniref:CARD domain-containing protein n=1 Tax=Oncorhynchus tshawytscha TaxID=74940 RepID=A0A8C8CDH4_ONCTS
MDIHKLIHTIQNTTYCTKWSVSVYIQNNTKCSETSESSSLAGSLSAAPQHTSPSGPMMSSVHDFLKTHKNDLENRMGNLRPILSNLIDLGVLSEEDREEIEIKTTRTKKNEALLTMVINKGKTAQEHFYQALKKADPYLVKDLEG